jgi:hypothetical protein
MDDVCHAEVRYMPLKCTHEELCESANDLFKRYAGLCNLIIKRNETFISSGTFTSNIINRRSLKSKISIINYG